jgi:hypothetical protein
MDELMAPNRLELANKLKPLISEDTVRIEEKNIPIHEMRNLAAFIGFMNFQNAVVLEPSDRRFFVYFSPAQKRPKEYYDGLWPWMEGNAGVVLK